MIPSLLPILRVDRRVPKGRLTVGPQKHEDRSKFAPIVAFPLVGNRPFRAFADLRRALFVLLRTKVAAA